MPTTIEAIYENGLLRPLQELNLSEGQTVQLTLVPQPKLSPQEILDLAADVYRGLSQKEIDEIEAIALGHN
ncbi:MAG: antitoxin family protein [Spirulinaceae cyanobacterium]